MQEIKQILFPVQLIYLLSTEKLMDITGKVQHMVSLFIWKINGALQPPLPPAKVNGSNQNSDWEHN